MITPNGRDLLRRMWPAYRSAIARHVGRKLGGETQARALADLLGRLIETGSAGS
jgi:hypothetical protein